ncbi:hypothetical protein GR247_17445 [Rhizobium leguminosarum]|nr:hypothetical protein [Rhizobium leguminosarum]NKK54859.1 hypothetical protein [Rhizobium leguminosarum bv. viciae]
MPAVPVVSTIFAVVQTIYARLERRASFRTHKGRSNTLNLRIVLSENRFRFSGRCASLRNSGYRAAPSYAGRAVAVERLGEFAFDLESHIAVMAASFIEHVVLTSNP